MGNKKIAILFSDNSNSGFVHDYFSRILESFKVYVERSGYTISFLNSDATFLKQNSYVQQMIDNSFDALFIANINFDMENVQELLSSDFKIITIDYNHPNVHSISSDNKNGMEQLLNYVCSKGHKKIAYISGDQDSHVNVIRQEMFSAYCAEHGCLMLPEYICESKYRDMRLTARRTEELLALPVPPTCILFPDDYAAIGGINVLRNRGMDIPQDISFCGFDGVNLVSLLSPIITTVVQDTEEMGQIAAKKIIDMINNNFEGRGDCTIVPTRLLEGQTVKDLIN